MDSKTRVPATPKLSPKKKSPRRRTRVLSARDRILLGGLGALTPILLNFLVLDVEKVFAKVTLIVCVGYAARIVLLFYLGGVVAYLHKTERSAFKLFELGIVAPALLTTMMNGFNAARAEATAPPPQQKATQGAEFSILNHGLVTSAYAQSIPISSPEPSKPPEERNESVKTFSPPQETNKEQFLRGLFGSTSPRVWYVVVGPYSSLENAKRQADIMNQRYSGFSAGFSADVYKSYDTPYYVVVIGANLTLSEATNLKKRAEKFGVPKEIYLKRGPDSV
jgi:hypothetical protein